MNVLFMDINNVFNSPHWRQQVYNLAKNSTVTDLTATKPSESLDPRTVSTFNDAYLQIAYRFDVVGILSSTWRLHDNVYSHLLNAGLLVNFIGQTESAETRAIEITNWLDSQDTEPNYIVIDDELKPLCGKVAISKRIVIDSDRIVHVNSQCGFRLQDGTRLVKLANEYFK